MRDLTQVIQKLIDKNTFTQKESVEIMEFILSGKASDAELAAFLTAMRVKGEDQTELLGFIQAIRKHAVKVKSIPGRLLDVCGTGGTLMDTFNISTLSAFVAAAAGVRIAKQVYSDPEYGCSSLQLLARLGIPINISPEHSLKLLEKTGLTFLYLPLFHPRLAQMVRVSRQIGIRNLSYTLFPLINPLRLYGQVIGVFNEKMTTLLSSVLRAQGLKRAYVVHGVEGLDEISVSAATRISELKDGIINTSLFNPEQLGLTPESVSGLQCANVTDSAQICKVILSGREESARTDTVALNAAAAIVAAGLAPDLAMAFQKAKNIIASGLAWQKLERLVEAAQSSKLKQKRTASRSKVFKKKRKSRK